MKVIFEETIGRLAEKGYHIKLFGRSQEHNEPYNIPYLLYTEQHEHDQITNTIWLLISKAGDAAAIRTAIGLIDSQRISMDLVAE